MNVPSPQLLKLKYIVVANYLVLGSQFSNGHARYCSRVVNSFLGCAAAGSCSRSVLYTRQRVTHKQVFVVAALSRILWKNTAPHSFSCSPLFIRNTKNTNCYLSRILNLIASLNTIPTNPRAKTNLIFVCTLYYLGS